MHATSYDRRSFLATGLSAAVGLALAPALRESPQDLAGLTASRASELLRRNALSSVELVQVYLRRIEEYNPALNAFITVTGEQALASAREMDEERRRGHWRGPLHGIPIALKDLIDTAGVRTTAASELFKERVPSEDAEVVRRLRSAGAIILGKTNLHEFAYGGTSAVSYFGPVHNPWALDRIPGGSSGGSAAATAAALCSCALGTDTAGSVRIPAAYCGIVGFKPTYGRVSNRGVVPESWTLDHVGPMCRSVEDAALMLAAIAGYDELDPTTVNMPVTDYSRALRMQTSRLRLGVPRRPFFDGLHPEIANAMDSAIGLLRRLSGSVEEIALPPTAVPLDRLFTDVRSVEAYTYHSQWVSESPEKYQVATRQRIVENAASVSPSSYARSRRALDVARREIKKTFAVVDLLITPTMALLPAKISDNVDAQAGANYPLAIRNTAPFDVLGLPTISVPCGFTISGLPIGLQISGAPFAESTVLALAYAYEQATNWHNMHPKSDLH
jgi:aspartyl-tRNA(Asn)/glutamyl-tRNA(Gln) amidotransferase subunit A